MKISSSSRHGGGSGKVGEEISLPLLTQLFSVCSENKSDREAVAGQWFGPGCAFSEKVLL